MNISKKFKALGKEIEILFYNQEQESIDFFIKEIELEEKRLEKIFNFYDKNSELSKLNKKRKINASEELLFVIKKSLEFSEITRGSYDVTLGKKFLDRKSNNKLSKLKCSYKNVVIKENKITLDNTDVIIDLGSIAKGYIVDRLTDFIKKLGIDNFLIDARGDIRISGDIEETISIQHPRDENNILDSFRIKNKAVATSGDYKQYIGKFENSHILNASDFISVTVISNNLVDADVLATAIFVTDRDKLSIFTKKFKDASFFIVKKDLTVIKHNWKNE